MSTPKKDSDRKPTPKTVRGWMLLLTPPADPTAKPAWDAWARCPSGPDYGQRIVFASGDQAMQLLTYARTRMKHTAARLVPTYDRTPNARPFFGRA